MNKWVANFKKINNMITLRHVFHLACCSLGHSLHLDIYSLGHLKDKFDHFYTCPLFALGWLFTWLLIAFDHLFTWLLKFIDWLWENLHVIIGHLISDNSCISRLGSLKKVLFKWVAIRSNAAETMSEGLRAP